MNLFARIRPIINSIDWSYSVSLHVTTEPEPEPEPEPFDKSMVKPTKILSFVQLELELELKPCVVCSVCMGSSFHWVKPLKNLRLLIKN